MEKKVYENPTIEIISFAANENLATDGDNITSGNDWWFNGVDENAM